MTILTVASVLTFCAVLSFVEVPKMVKGKEFRELILYSVLLTAGAAVMVLRSVNIKIPNPSDLVIWIYSPVSGFMKQLLR